MGSDLPTPAPRDPPRGRWRKPRISRLLLFAIPLVLVVAGSVALGPYLTLLDPAHGLWGLTEPWGNQTFTLPGLEHPVTIIRDGAGTAHIFAQDDQDLLFAQGYAQASDRLFQMEVESLAAQGNVSSWVGPSGLTSDIAFRTLGLPQAALEMQAEVASVSPTLSADLNAYSAGVNAYIAWAEAHDRLPLEMVGLGITPYKWNPYATFAWQELMTWGQTTGISEPIWAGLAQDAVGDTATNEMFPLYSDYWQNYTVMPGDGTTQNGVSLSSKGVSPSYVFSQDWLAPWATGVSAAEESALAPVYHAALNATTDPYIPVPEVTQGGGSNSWVVNGSRTSDGMAILANDPHLPIQLPSLWVATELIDPNYDVSGWSLAGLPGVLIGHNPHVAWALTNSEGATALDYVETLSGNSYYENGSWHPLTIWNESWSVAATSSTTARTETIQLESAGDNGRVLARDANYGLALRWKADGPTWEAMAEMEFDKAQSVDQFFSILHQWWTVPNLNVLVAENNRSAGTTHIGWDIPCQYPLINVTMPNGQHVLVVGSRAPMNGNGSLEPSGYVPAALEPTWKDPGDGYFYAPNQPTVGQNYPYPFIGGFWDSGGRAHAIGNFLKSHPTMSVGLMQVLQANVTDQWSLLLKPQLVSALQNVTRGSDSTAASLATTVLPIVEGWNGSFNVGEVAPTIYSYWMNEVVDSSYVPLLKAHDFSTAPDPFPDSLQWISKNDPTSVWFPNGWSDLANRSAASALDLLSSDFAKQGVSSPTGWTWGVAHPFTMPSLTGEAQFAVGPYPWWGDGYTVSVAPFTTNLTFPLTQVSISSSLRMVSEPDPSSPVGGVAYGILPGGASEDPVSPYYADLLGNWIDHTYVDMSLVMQSSGPFPQHVVSTWTLQP